MKNISRKIILDPLIALLIDCTDPNNYIYVIYVKCMDSNKDLYQLAFLLLIDWSYRLGPVSRWHDILVKCRSQTYM